MASISVAGTVVGKAGESPVTIREFSSGSKVAVFSVVDKQYVYAKPGEERKGQFYQIEVIGKAGEIAAERLNRGDRIAVNGQLVQREYNGKTYLDVKNGNVTFLELGNDGSKSIF
jgi:single-stranded DNA-binding protein